MAEDQCERASVPSPSQMGEGDYAKHGGGGSGSVRSRRPPPPPPSAVPLPRFAWEEPRRAIVVAARSWIGTPYRHQAALKGVGCDCLGLLIGVWRELQASRDARRRDAAFVIPPYTPDWAEAIRRETFAEGLRRHLDEIEPSAAREGDIVLFRWRAHLPAKHAGILTAPDRMVHAQEGAVVSEVPLSAWWRRRMAYGFNLSQA
jgi:NlpC/P60 family putative phage cell wall peptidase